MYGSVRETGGDWNDSRAILQASCFQFFETMLMHNGIALRIHSERLVHIQWSVIRRLSHYQAANHSIANHKRPLGLRRLLLQSPIAQRQQLRMYHVSHSTRPSSYPWVWT